MIVRPAQLLRGLAVVAFLIAWALLAHYGTAGDSSPDLSVLLGVSPIIAAVGLLLWRTRHPLLAGGGNLLLFGGLIWLSSVAQTLPDHGDNPRFLIPLQSWVVFCVLWLAWSAIQSLKRQSKR